MYKFTHENAFTVAEAEKMLKPENNAAVIAGGTDLLTTMKSMCEPFPPKVLVNIKTISPSMDYIKTDGGTLKIGALTTLTTIANSSTIKTSWQVLADAALSVASPELRNTGTIGGNICQKPRCIYYRKEYNAFWCARKNNSPDNECYANSGVNRYHSIFGHVRSCFAVCPSDIAPALVALNADILTNKKTWKAADFFVVKGEQINAIETDEIVTEIQVPALPSGTKSAYKKFAFRKAVDFPLVSCAAVITTAGGNVSKASIVLGGVYNSPKRVTAAEDSITGKSASSDSDCEKAGKDGLATGTNPLSGTKYKITVAETLIKRAIKECA